MSCEWEQLKGGQEGGELVFLQARSPMLINSDSLSVEPARAHSERLSVRRTNWNLQARHLLELLPYGARVAVNLNSSAREPLAACRLPQGAAYWRASENGLRASRVIARPARRKRKRRPIVSRSSRLASPGRRGVLRKRRASAPLFALKSSVLASEQANKRAIAHSKRQ